MPSAKIGNPRKSRRRRLRVAAYRGTLQYEPTEAEWKAIGQAYGVQLTDRQKQRLAEIVMPYFRDQPFERAAPFADEASRYLEKATNTARAFVRALQFKPPEASATDAVFHVRDLIEDHLRVTGQMVSPERKELAESLDVVKLTSLIVRFVVACNAAKMKLAEEAVTGVEEGQAWNELIRALTDFAEGHGLPTGASKGSDKSKTDKPSPFVAFVHALQNSFPEHLRRHNLTLEALAWAIGKARKSERARERISRRSQN